MIRPLQATGDPEWLPSTIVQSSAALVAIVGGLLVARLVGMSGERAAAEQRLQEVEDTLSSAEKRHRELVARRAAWDFGDFIASAADLYFGGEARTVEDLAAQISYGQNDAERRQFANTFLKWVSALESPIRSAFDQGDRSVDELRSSGLSIEPLFESAAEELLRQLDSTTSSSPFGFAAPITPSSLLFTSEARRTVKLQRWDALLRDIEQASERVSELRQERERTLRRLESLSPGGEIRSMLFALGGVVVAGIAFPVVVMATRMPDLRSPWRWSMVGAFLGSVVVVGLTIWSFARSMESASDSEHPSRETEV